MTTPKQRDLSTADIVTRLDNWGACQRGRSGGTMVAKQTRSGYGGGGYTCMTAVACNLMRMAAQGPKGGTASQSRLDFTDSATITEAWRKCGVRTKTILKDFYALGRPMHILCRELNIKHWPASHWARELKTAQDEIESILKGPRHAV